MYNRTHPTFSQWNKIKQQAKWTNVIDTSYRSNKYNKKKNYVLSAFRWLKYYTYNFPYWRRYLHVYRFPTVFLFLKKKSFFFSLLFSLVIGCYKKRLLLLFSRYFYKIVCFVFFLFSFLVSCYRFESQFVCL